MKRWRFMGGYPPMKRWFFGEENHPCGAGRVRSHPSSLVVVFCFSVFEGGVAVAVGRSSGDDNNDPDDDDDGDNGDGDDSDDDDHDGDDGEDNDDVDDDDDGRTGTAR